MSDTLTLSEAARYVGVPENQLRIWADMNVGPKFTGNPYIPHRMEYRKADLEAWLSGVSRASLI